MVRFPADDILPAATLRVLAYLLDRFGRSGTLSPTVQELADALGYSLVVTHRHLSRLRSHGLVDWEPRKSRTLRVRCVWDSLPD